MSLPWAFGVALGVRWDAAVSCRNGEDGGEITIRVRRNSDLVQSPRDDSHIVILAMTREVAHVHPDTFPEIVHDVHIETAVVFLVMSVR